VTGTVAPKHQRARAWRTARWKSAMGKDTPPVAVISRKAASRVTSLRTQPKGILLGAQETVLAGDLLSRERDQAFRSMERPELSLDAVQDLGEGKGERAFLEYVEAIST